MNHLGARALSFGFGFLVAVNAWGTTPLEFYRDAEPLLRAKCMNCHNPKGMAPFSLVEYGDVARRLRKIRAAVAEKVMPPWPPDKECSHDFKHDLSLSDAQIGTLVEWIDGGGQRGNPPADYTPPQFSDGWPAGTPEVITGLAQVYQPPQDQGHDTYRCFVLPEQFAEDKYLVKQQYKPGNKSIVHHMLLYFDSSGRAVEKLDPKNPEAGYDCLMSSGVAGSVPLGGWAPGTNALEFPAGSGAKLTRGGRLILQIHYSFVKHGEHRKTSEGDQSQLGLDFAKTPVTQDYHLRMLAKAAGSFDGVNGIYFSPVGQIEDLFIPAGAEAHPASFEVTLKKDLIFSQFMPHMHLLGKQIQLSARRPGTDRDECLVRINNWDFNWQIAYFLKEPKRFPAGTVLKISGIYDNSENNPNQVNHPPKDVRWGPSSSDEMLLMAIGFTESGE